MTKTYWAGIHGISDTRQDIGDVELIPRAEANAMVAAAEAAALMGALDVIKAQPYCYDSECDMGAKLIAAIRALITPDAQSALDQVIAEAKAEGMREAAEKIQIACDGSLSLEARSDEDCAYDDGVREGCAAALHAILAAADAIQKEGGA